MIKSLDWKIQLPSLWSSFFKESGESAVLASDQRQSRRVNVRSLAVMRSEKVLKIVPRTREAVGVYSKDFSKRGCGFICPFQLFPEEIVLIVLPTFWIRLHVVRARRIGAFCYEVGGELLEQHKPDMQAFDGFLLPNSLTASNA